MKVYKIVKYDLIDKVLYTCKEESSLEMREINGRKTFYGKGSNIEAQHSYLWEYSIIPKENAINPDEKFMPYFADVIEDVPNSLRKFRKTYKGCQLMVEKHGGYLQFWHEETKEILRIAINSNYYTPIK